MNKAPDTQNFQVLCDLLEKFKKSSEEDSVLLINEMYETEGYDEWLNWIEQIDLASYLSQHPQANLNQRKKMVRQKLLMIY